MIAKVGLMLALALAFLLALLTVVLLIDFHGRTSSDGGVSCKTLVPQNLIGSAGDGQVALTWGVPAESPLRVKSWRYIQSQGNTRTTHDTGSASTSHVVLGLTNGVPYSFRVRAILESDLKDCWSNAVEVTPTQPGNVLEAMEKHQQKIAENTTKIATEVVASGGVAKELGERAVDALAALAGSANTMAAESTILRNDLSENLDDLSKNVDEAGRVIAAGLARIEDKLDICYVGTAQLCDGENVGSLYFDHDSYNLASDDESLRIAARLQELAKGRLVLVVGYATAVGFARHNLHLSEMRAACTVRCLRDGLGDQQRLAFREIAMGEVLEESNPRGNNRRSRRVDVVVCPANMTDPITPLDARTGFESATVDCGCPT